MCIIQKWLTIQCCIWVEQSIPESCVPVLVLLNNWEFFFFCASGPRAGSTRAPPGEGTGARERPPWEGAQAERAGKGERAGTGEREPAKEGRMGEGSSETGRKGGKAERAASQRAAGEKRWEGEATQTTFAHKHATQVSFKLPTILDRTKSYNEEVTNGPMHIVQNW